MEVPVRFINGRDVTGMTSMQEVRAELLSASAWEVAELHPWLHYLPAALAVPSPRQSSQ